ITDIGSMDKWFFYRIGRHYHINLFTVNYCCERIEFGINLFKEIYVAFFIGNKNIGIPKWNEVFLICSGKYIKMIAAINREQCITQTEAFRFDYIIIFISTLF